MHFHLFLTVLLALFCAYGLVAVLAFEWEQQMYVLRHENPCAFKETAPLMWGDGLKGMLLRSCLWGPIVYFTFRYQPIPAREDET